MATATLPRTRTKKLTAIHDKVEILRAAVFHTPKNPFAHNNLGCELENLPGRTAEAIAELD